MKITGAFAAFAATVAVAPAALAFSPAPRSAIATSARTSALFAVDDKTEVREYFNNEGFNRWNKIYSESDEVNNVQLDIRDGHGQTIQKILNWIDDDGDIKGKTVADCGCGVGSLAIPLAQMGAKISASDISDAMAGEAAARAKSMGIRNAKFYTSDLESVKGKYNTVTCVDVAIHYPTEKMSEMVGHLCSLADERVLISFAPKTWYSAFEGNWRAFPWTFENDTSILARGESGTRGFGKCRV